MQFSLFAPKGTIYPARRVEENVNMRVRIDKAAKKMW